MTRRYLTQLFIAVLAALSVPIASAETGQTRPFSGYIIGHFVGTPTGVPEIYRARAEAVGISSHIGRFLKVTDDVFNSVTGEVNGTFRMTTAQGEFLFGEYSGYAVPVMPTFFRWRLYANITGGTGRFEGASGDFIFTAQGQVFSQAGNIYGDYTESIEGTINY